MMIVAGLVGGLALFLYGMSVMSGGLTKISGGTLEKILSGVTKNRLVAYLFGVGVTALVQSSSTSTVMVVGLVNSGIMNLTQAVNVILGANLGTTANAWLLSLNAIEGGGHSLLTIFKPATFTPFLAFLGIILYMAAKKDRRKNIGTILLGFAILMTGMQTMSGAVAPLSDNPTFTRILTAFANPVIGFLCGILFTMVIQSSAATIGILMALASSVFISMGMAIPIVIGAEVGTCVTAILSSLGANKNGKRTALMHLYFNIIKATSFMVIFYTLNAFLHFSFLENKAGMVAVAGIHTLVNLVATLIMLPFSGLLVKLVLRTIPIDDKEKEEHASLMSLRAMDDRFLNNPPFALEQARTAACVMAGYSMECIDRALTLIASYTPEGKEEVVRLENRIDRYEDEIGSYLVKIYATELDIRTSHSLSVILHSIGDFERISDHARNIAETMAEMEERELRFTDKAYEEFAVFAAAVREIVSMSVEAFSKNDHGIAEHIEPLEEVIDSLNMEIKKRHIRRLRKGKCSVELGPMLTDVATDCERVADHCSNIAVAVMQVREDGFDAHEYLEIMRSENNPAFERRVSRFEAKYALPDLKKEKAEEERKEKAEKDKAAKEKPDKEKPEKEKGDKEKAGGKDKKKDKEKAAKDKKHLKLSGGTKNEQ
ncbi:MAG: Na/Pi cotransporter family protein [Lachnospiraceae bacterium]|nr:Na/Pi cotransporter family protein [Lachnospiraceae bacterium]